jgi:peptidoglycan/LPS O-acetylase OafA/YrhL
MMTQSKQRYGFIDAIRGIAACLVMLQHSLYQSGLLYVGPNGTHTGFIPKSLELGETGVVAFFLVSGFVIPLSLEKTGNLKLFWIHRALRIYPLYLLIYFLSFAIQAGGHIRSVEGFVANFVASLFFVQEYLKTENFVGGSWTLSLELAWYLGIAFLFFVSLNKKTNLIVGFSVLASLLAQVSCAVGFHLPMGRLSMLLCCVFGLVCYRFSRAEIAKKHFAILFCVLFFTIGLNLFVGEQLFPSAHPSATFRMASDSWALAAIVFFVPFFNRQKALWNHSVLNFLGRVSYSIYLLHPVVLMLLSRAHLTGVLVIASTFAITIPASAVTYQVIEKPPIQFGHRLKPATPTRVVAAQEPA